MIEWQILYACCQENDGQTGPVLKPVLACECRLDVHNSPASNSNINHGCNSHQNEQHWVAVASSRKRDVGLYEEELPQA